MLSVKNIHFAIGEAAILNGLEMSGKDGERIGIIGPNGSGKTTFFNCVSGFITPQKGEINFNGHSVIGTSPSKRASLGIGRVFQNFGIFRDMTVKENILIALESRDQNNLLSFKVSKEHLDEIDSLLNLVGLNKHLNSKAGSLSGGQLRLLEIIRLVAFRAKVYLLDEPTAGVSPKMKGQIVETLKNLIPKEALVLIIEHDISFMKDLCERIVVFDGGKCVLDGSFEEVRSDTRLQEIYFGTTN